MRILPLIVCLCFLTNNTKAQNLIDWSWQNIDNIIFKDIEYKDNFVYAVGYFTAPSVSLNGTTYYNLGGSDILICKMDTLGNVIWANHYGSIYNETLENLCIDNSGSICAVGTMEGTLAIDTNILVSNGGKDILMIRCGNTGILQLAKSVGNIYTNTGMDVTTDNNNDIYVAGNSYGVVSFAAANCPVNTSVLFLKYSNSGTPIWFNWIRGSTVGPPTVGTTAEVTSIKFSAIDSSIVYGGGLIVAGGIQYSNGLFWMTYTQGLGVYGRDLIIGKFKKNGECIFIKNLSNTNNNVFQLADLAIKNNGHIVYNYRYQYSLNGFTENHWSIADINGSMLTNQGFSLNSNASWIGYCVAPNQGAPQKMQIDDSIIYTALYQQSLNCSASNCSDYYGIKYNMNSNSLEYAALDPDKLYSCAAGFNNQLFLAGSNSIGKSCNSNCSLGLLHLNPAPNKYICTSGSVQIGFPECYYVQGGTPLYNFSWSPSVGLSDSNVPQPDVYGLTSTTVYTLTVIDQAMNVIRDTVTVFVMPKPVVTYTSSPLSPICKGDSVWIYFSGADLYYPNPYAVGDSFDNPLKIAVNQDTVFTVIGINQDSLCQTNGFTHVNIITKKINAFAMAPVLCTGDTAKMVAYGNASNYLWQPGNVNNDTSFAIVDSSNVFTVTGVDSTGCITTASVPVYISPGISSAASDTTICKGATITLSSSGSGYVGANQMLLPTGYCFPTTGQTNNGNCIHSVAFNTLSNYNNGFSVGGFSNFANSVPYTTVIKGNSYNLKIQNPYGGAIQFGVWIDYDLDGTFDNNGEFVMKAQSNSIKGFYLDTMITIPQTAWTGKTRMRIVSNVFEYLDSSKSCFNFSNGEFEDYAIQIIELVPLSTYSWTPNTSPSIGNSVSATPTSFGLNTYYTTATDEIGCALTDSINVYVDTGVSLSINQSICADQLPYLWNNQSINLAGSYFDTLVSLNGCDSTITLNLTVHPLPNIAINSNPSPPTVCQGQQVTLIATGGSVITWSGSVSNNIGFIPAATTVYTVTCIDSNLCTSTATQLVSVNALPALSIIANPSNATVCDGQVVTLTGSRALSYTYTGGIIDNTSFTPTQTSTYTITGTDANNCSSTATQLVSVIANTTPLLSISASTTQGATGDPITYTATHNLIAPYSIDWFRNSILQTTTTTDTWNTTIIDSTNYVHAILKAPTQCLNPDSVQSNALVVNNITSISTVTIKDISIYPNPFTNCITIQGLLPDDAVTIYNQLGQTLIATDGKRIQQNNNSLQLDNYAKGVYILKLKRDKQQHSFKLVN
ncbi:MAG: hypothetical protein RL660_2835 [Bacteroidota bacterium]|jgi:hypothetical protein